MYFLVCWLAMCLGALDLFLWELQRGWFHAVP
jgi:hypothetical protein